MRFPRLRFTHLAPLGLALSVVATPAQAQNPVMESLQGLFQTTSSNVMASAELLDESLYTYRPTEGVRSMGELFGHVAGAQYLFCSAAAGEASPSSVNYEAMANDKAAIIEGLRQAFAYCDTVMSELTDAQGTEARQFFTGPNTVIGILAFNAAHNYEHYGNLVTYMRMNGIVPPSSR